MKYILTPLILFLVWKIWRDWENVRKIRAQHQAREIALSEFEALITTLEMKQANGELTPIEFQSLREKAITQLKMRLGERHTF